MPTRFVEPAPLETLSPHSASAALPGFNRLASSACWAGLLPIALLLLGRQIALAGSVALGVAVSLGVCGLLFLFVERVMPVLVGSARSNMGMVHGSQVQFLLLLGAKLVFISLVGAAFLTLHPISPVAVLVGFLVGQSTMVLQAVRFRKL